MTATIIKWADAFNQRACDLAAFDALECPNCATVTEPHRVTEGPVVHYDCKMCDRYWWINQDGDMLRGRTGSRFY